MKVLHIDLWKCYLSYVRETKGKLPSYKYVIFCLDMLKQNVHLLKRLLRLAETQDMFFQPY